MQMRQLSLGEKMLSLLLRTLPIKHGKHRLLDWVAPKCWVNDNRPVLISDKGHEILVDPNDLVGWHFAILKSFDPEVVEILEKACAPREKEVFWDIGANKGACFCSLAINLPSLCVVAIEPQSSLEGTNLRNLNSICADRHEYFRVGIGEREAELTLTIPGSNLGRASLHIQGGNPDDAQELIRIRTATQIAEASSFGWPTIVKIDVEGHEPQVFRSLEPCLASKKCKAIVFENHNNESDAFSMIHSIALLHGYDVYGVAKSPWSTRLILTRQQLPGITDYAALRHDLSSSNKQLAALMV